MKIRIRLQNAMLMIICLVLHPQVDHDEELISHSIHKSVSSNAHSMFLLAFKISFLHKKTSHDEKKMFHIPSMIKNVLNLLCKKERHRIKFYNSCRP